MDKRVTAEREVRRWFERTASFAGVGSESVREALLAILRERGFRRIAHKEYQQTTVVEAYYGAKLRAWLVGSFVPFGRLLPAGKRLNFRARITCESDSCAVLMRLVPYMELFDTEEIGVITQDESERFTDDYVASVKLQSIVRKLYERLGLAVPEELQRVQHKRLALDLLWAWLLYPTDTYNAPKRIHVPAEPGPTWSWGAFLIPELWFIYYDAWGVAFGALSVDSFSLGLTGALSAALGPFGVAVGLILFLAGRVPLGRYGERIHYARHGYWRGQRDATK